MKKYFLSIAVFLSMALGAKAQFSLGAKAGINFSHINTTTFNESSVAGYQAGLFARLGSKNLYLQPEIYLSSNGGKFNTTSSGTDYSAKVKFTQLNVPLLLGRSFGGDNLNVHIAGGLVYSYILNKSTSLSNNFNQAYADFGNYKNSTLGYQAGGGIDLGHILVDIRYEGGLTKINENYGQRQNLWTISVGFKIFQAD